jgi:hypothetical protein
MMGIWPLAGMDEIPSNDPHGGVKHHIGSSQMRRPLAILLMLFFALGPLQGVLDASEDSHLPACCRRQGAHHCILSAEMQSALEHADRSTPAFTAPATCTSFPGFALKFSTPSHALTVSGCWTPALLVEAPSPLPPSVDVRTTTIPARSGRAPPSFV